jgi:hypothetical protein
MSEEVYIAHYAQNQRNLTKVFHSAISAYRFLNEESKEARLAILGIEKPNGYLVKPPYLGGDTFMWHAMGTSKSGSTLPITSFIYARIFEFRNVTSNLGPFNDLTQPVQNMLDSFEKILQWHDNWPVLTETEPQFELNQNPIDDFDSFRYSITTKMAWLTQQQYVETFGTAPPTAPILKFIAATWDYHPDYNEEWRVTDA